MKKLLSILLLFSVLLFHIGCKKKCPGIKNNNWVPYQDESTIKFVNDVDSDTLSFYIIETKRTEPYKVGKLFYEAPCVGTLEFMSTEENFSDIHLKIFQDGTENYYLNYYSFYSSDNTVIHEFDIETDDSLCVNENELELLDTLRCNGKLYKNVLHFIEYNDPELYFVTDIYLASNIGIIGFTYLEKDWVLVSE